MAQPQLGMLACTVIGIFINKTDTHNPGRLCRKQRCVGQLVLLRLLLLLPLAPLLTVLLPLLP